MDALIEVRQFFIDNAHELCRSPQFASALLTYNLLKKPFFKKGKHELLRGELEVSNVVRLHCVLSDIYTRREDLVTMYEVIKHMKFMYPTLYKSLDGAAEMDSSIEHWEARARRMEARAIRLALYGNQNELDRENNHVDL